MKRCLICGHGIPDELDICAWHGKAEYADWAAGNRAACDFYHRRIVRHDLIPAEDGYGRGLWLPRPAEVA